MSLTNSVFYYVKENGISPVSFWPFEDQDSSDPDSLQAGRPAGDGGPWTLYMDHTSGAMYLWPTDKRVPVKLNPNVIARGGKEELRKAFQQYATNEWGRDAGHPYKYQENAHRFNWPTGTLAGVAIAIKVITASLAGDISRGWEIGKAYENKVDRAMDPEWWAKYDASMAAESGA